MVKFLVYTLSLHSASVADGWWYLHHTEQDHKLPTLLLQDSETTCPLSLALFKELLKLDNFHTFLCSKYILFAHKVL